MYKAIEKYVKTRKPHECHECKRIIVKGENCYFFKSVAFGETGRNEFEQFYVCGECDLKAREED